MNSLAPILLGLISAACWGAGDFSGGLATKRANVYSVVIASQFIGMILLIGLAVAFSESTPTLLQITWGGAAGVAGAIGLIALYRALSLGRMGVAAPVSGVVTAIVPVIGGMFIEGLPKTIQLIGFIVAMIGVWFVSRADDSKINWRDLNLPIVAGLGFGFFLIFINRASGSGILLPLVAARAASLGVTVIATLIMRQPLSPKIDHLPLIAIVGVMDAAGNAFYAWAAQLGRLDVAAVLSSLYPASTILLAWIILKERLARMQWVGVAATMLAIVLITL
ncbi:MAG: DMT family transporter [Chloroflexota bacterium]